MTLQPKLGLSRLVVEDCRSHSLRHTHTHTHTHTHPPACECLLLTSDQPVAEATAYVTNINHKRRTTMSSVGFEPSIPAIKQSQTYALDRTATIIGDRNFSMGYKLITTICAHNFWKYMKHTYPQPRKFRTFSCILFFNILAFSNFPFDVCVTVHHW